MSASRFLHFVASVAFVAFGACVVQRMQRIRSLVSAVRACATSKTAFPQLFEHSAHATARACAHLRIYQMLAKGAYGSSGSQSTTSKRACGEVTGEPPRAS